MAPGCRSQSAPAGRRAAHCDEATQAPRSAAGERADAVVAPPGWAGALRAWAEAEVAGTRFASPGLQLVLDALWPHMRGYLEAGALKASYAGFGVERAVLGMRPPALGEVVIRTSEGHAGGFFFFLSHRS